MKVKICCYKKQAGDSLNKLKIKLRGTVPMKVGRELSVATTDAMKNKSR